LQALALVLLLALWRSGFLLHVEQASRAQILGFAGLSCAALLWLCWQVRHLFAHTPSKAELDLTADLPLHQEPPMPPLPRRIMMTPSWKHGALFDADTKQPIEEAQERLHLPEPVRDLLGDWIVQFIHLADAADPWRCALLDPATQEQLSRGGEAARVALAACIGDRELIYCPQALPVAASIDVSDLELRADQGCWALWFGPQDDGVGDIPADQLGLSWGLARAIEQWGYEIEEPQVDLQEHDKNGAILAERLRRELAATGRESVRVRFSPSLK
jgi:hypothetical protein